ncbi:hypothetical protein TrRE_jg6705, partial [Triparma retinervis]
ERRGESKTKKKGSRKEDKKRKGGEGKVIKYWEALMKVDPSLTEKEARKIAHRQGE